MKKISYLKRTERNFQNGESVYLRLKPYRQLWTATRQNQKLAPRYYKPLLIEEKVGKVAYRLQMPLESKVHPVFHISSLKKKLGSSIELQPRLPPVNIDDSFFPEPEKILDRRLRQHGRRALTEILLKWVGMDE